MECKVDSGTKKLVPDTSAIGAVESGFDQGFDKFLKDLWKAHSNVVDAQAAWETAITNDKVDDVLEGLDDPTNTALQNAAKLPDLIKAAFPPALGALKELYCGFFDTANELAGLNSRIESLATAIDITIAADGKVNIEGLQEHKALIAEVRRVVAARRAALRRLQQQLAKLLNALEVLITDEGNLTLLAAIGALAYIAARTEPDVVKARVAAEAVLVAVLKSLFLRAGKRNCTIGKGSRDSTRMA